MVALDVFHPHTVDAAKSLLAQGGVHIQPDAARSLHLPREWVRSLPGARKVAADEVVDWLPRQALRQPLGLRMAGSVERHIHLPLETQLAVPFGLTVAQEDQLCHAGVLRVPRTEARTNA